MVEVRLYERVGNSCVIMINVPGNEFITAYHCCDKDGEPALFEFCTQLYRITEPVRLDQLDLVRGICEGYVLARDGECVHVATAGGITDRSKLNIATKESHAGNIKAKGDT